MPPTAAAPPSPRAAALLGLAGLAAAMGIGRFAFTPLLPLMQQQQGLTLADGSWLATANYLGYLLGALACFALPTAPGTLARFGLAAVAALTLAMGLTEQFGAWLLWRLAAGAASACVLVGVTGWALPILAAQPGRAGALAGRLFAGVGVGIVVAGAVGLAVGAAAQPPTLGWLALGALATAVAAAAWRPLAAPPAAGAHVSAAAAAPAARSGWWPLIACYGALGVGYILPATFLPAIARELLAEPALFGWVWPVFGAAAAASTLLAARWAGGASPRRVWALSQLPMALGVLASLLRSPAALALSALCVGGTFMVATMAGLQEARRVAGTAAPKLIAAMTAAFALGQLVAPLAVGALAAATAHGALPIASLAAAALLVASSAALLLGAPAPAPATLRSE